MHNYQVICYGEVLWDIFPTRKIIGGAPLNATFRLQSFGVDVALISRIGKDELGEGIQNYFAKHQLNSSLIQHDDSLPTGQVEISLNNVGVPSYSINGDSSWDCIALTAENTAAVKGAQFFLFGSLAVRDKNNLATLYRLLEIANIKIFDVNLRPPHFDLQTVFELMNQADVLKLNEEELVEIYHGSGTTNMQEMVLWLREETNTETICITMGANGALLHCDGQFYSQEGFQVDVIDTVGAGDSFLATLIDELLIKKKPPAFSLKKACAVGAYITSFEGASVDIPSDGLKNVGYN